MGACELGCPCEVCLSGVCCELGVLVRVLGVKTLE